MEGDIERKLVAILAADVVGFSRLMENDEVTTLRSITYYRSILDQIIQSHKGRIFGTAGDSLIAEFLSVVGAAECAIEIQDTVAKANEQRPPAEQMQFRIGLHTGDAIVRGDNLYGDVVNIASRLEGLAEPGSIWVSLAVREQIGTQIATSFTDVGDQNLKNISRLLRAYRMRGNLDTALVSLPHGIPAEPLNNFPIQLVRFSTEMLSVDSLLKTKLNLVFKNNGRRSAVLNKVTIGKKTSVTEQDCPHQGHRLFFPEWNYDVDIENDNEFVGRNYLLPNDVIEFNIIFAREEGGPRLTIYRVDSLFYFDEQAAPIAIKDLFIKVAGPGVALGSRAAPSTEKEWCECMWRNVKNFEAIGYDYKADLSQEIVERILRGIEPGSEA